MDQHKNQPVEKDELTGDKLISGHEYDDIRELDNRLPHWWTGLFLITIIFALIYVFRYHILKTAPLQEAEYNSEMMAAAEQYKNLPSATNSLDTTNLVALTDAAALAGGKEVWDKNCVVCHLAQGQGVVGPNLTDEYWIHGCDMKAVTQTIFTGVPEKGMISWKTQLNIDQIKQVASYVLTLKGTNPPNPKAPQGEKCE
jgi:cytochrome c oxidase cbb3-type subunit 3